MIIRMTLEQHKEMGWELFAIRNRLLKLVTVNGSPS
jgi:hypothetical protein